MLFGIIRRFRDWSRITKSSQGPEFLRNTSIWLEQVPLKETTKIQKYSKIERGVTVS